MLTRIPPSGLRNGRALRQIKFKEAGWLGSHFESDVSPPFLSFFHAGAGPLLAVRLHAVRGPVLGLVRLDGRMEDIGSVLDLKVEGIVGLGDFVDGAKDFFLSDVAEGTIL